MTQVKFLGRHSKILPFFAEAMERALDARYATKMHCWHCAAGLGNCWELSSHAKWGDTLDLLTTLGLTNNDSIEYLIGGDLMGQLQMTSVDRRGNAFPPQHPITILSWPSSQT